MRKSNSFRVFFNATIPTILVIFNSLWIPFVINKDVSFFFLNSKENITFIDILIDIGTIIFCIFTIVYIIYFAFKRRNELVKIDKIISDLQFLGKTGLGIQKIVENETNEYLVLILEHINDENPISNTDILKKRIFSNRKLIIQNVILKTLRTIIHSITEISEKDISVSFIYKLPWKEKWQSEEVNYKGESKANELVIKEGSTAYCLFNNTCSNPVFLHDKYKDGVLLGQYHKHSRESKTKKGKFGSLYGYKFILYNQNDEKYITAMLFISTFGKKICASNNEKVKETVEKNYISRILEPYSKLLERELLYMQFENISN